MLCGSSGGQYIAMVTIAMTIRGLSDPMGLCKNLSAVFNNLSVCSLQHFPRWLAMQQSWRRDASILTVINLIGARAPSYVCHKSSRTHTHMHTHTHSHTYYYHLCTHTLLISYMRAHTHMHRKLFLSSGFLALTSMFSAYMWYLSLSRTK